MATNWITNMATALRTCAMLALLGQGFAPADVLAMADVSVVVSAHEDFGYGEAA